MQRNVISLTLAVAAVLLIVWARATAAFAWLDPITSGIALVCLAVIIVIDVLALVRQSR